jgi:hypothetical protein
MMENAKNDYKNGTIVFTGGTGAPFKNSLQNKPDYAA